MAGRVVGALERTRAWGVVAKAESREAAAGVLRRAGGSPEAVERTLGAIEDSGENVRWNWGATSSNGAFGERSSSLKTPKNLPSDLRPLEAPEGAHWEFQNDLQFKKATGNPKAEAFTESDGRVVLHLDYKNVLENLSSADPRKVWDAIQLLRHEWLGHRSLTPMAGVPDEQLSLFYKKLRQLRWNMYFDNQFGKYAEETYAQSRSVNSLRDGLRYLSPHDPEGAARMARYGMTPQGIRRDAAKIALGTGLGVGATLGSASYVGSRDADTLGELLDAIRDEQEAARPARRIAALKLHDAVKQRRTYR